MTTEQEQEVVEEPNALEASLWRILVDPLEPETKTKNGIEYAKGTIEEQTYLQYIGKVVSMGPLCFTKAHHFADLDGKMHRACEVGDWIVYGKNTGVQVYVKEGDYGIRRLRVINDDQVLCKVDDVDRLQIPLN